MTQRDKDREFVKSRKIELTLQATSLWRSREEIAKQAEDIEDEIMFLQKVLDDEDFDQLR